MFFVPIYEIVIDVLASTIKVDGNGGELTNARTSYIVSWMTDAANRMCFAQASDNSELFEFIRLRIIYRAGSNPATFPKAKVWTEV